MDGNIAGSAVAGPRTTHDPEPRWLLSIPAACAGLGVGRSTVYELAAAGEIQIVRVGRRALVPCDSIDAYVVRLRTSDPVPRGMSSKRSPEAVNLGADIEGAGGELGDTGPAAYRSSTVKHTADERAARSARGRDHKGARGLRAASADGDG